jgi:integrase
MPVVKLTQRVVDDLVAAEAPDRDTFLWDQRQPGFGCRRKAGGAAVAFVTQWRDPGTGKSHRMVIGDARRLRLEDARAAAQKRAGQIAGGTNPVEERRTRRAAPTFGAWIDEVYLTSDAWARKASTTRAFDLGKIEAFIRPALGDKKLADITTGDLRRLQADLADPVKAAELARKGGRLKNTRRGGAGGARRTMRFLKAMLAFAVEVGDLEVNPAAKIRVGTDGQREAIPDDEAYQRLWAALARLRGEGGHLAKACDAVALIAMTGARRNEIAAVRVRHVSLTAKLIMLPPAEHKGGRKSGKARAIALPDEAVAILSGYKLDAPGRDPEAFVFAGGTGRPIALHRHWSTIAAEAELGEAITMHSLRHGIGTALAAAGMSPVQIAQQLGHAGWGVSQRYVHAVDKARQDLAQKAADLVRPAKLQAIK